MCGRFLQISSKKEIAERFLIKDDFQLEMNYNISPGINIGVIINYPEKHLTRHLWGFVPPCIQYTSKFKPVINAKAETLSEKTFFRDSFFQRRCLIIANGFYEWKKVSEKKIPFFIRLKNHNLFAFAGIFNSYRDGNGKDVSCCAIITTEPNTLVKEIHTRMPAILEQKNEQKWLDTNLKDINELSSLLKPYPPVEMELYEVPAFVNKTANNSPECIEPVK